MRKQHICLTNQQTAQKRGQSMVVCIRQAAILQLRLTGCEKIYTAMQCEMVQCNLHVHLKVIHIVTMYFNAGCDKIYTAMQCEMVSGQCISMQYIQCISMQSTMYFNYNSVKRFILQCNARWCAVSWLWTQCKDFISCHHNASQCISMQSTVHLNATHTVFECNLQCISMLSTVHFNVIHNVRQCNLHLHLNVIHNPFQCNLQRISMQSTMYLNAMQCI